MDSLRSLITGISGQDGYYLARELLSHGRIVHGMSRAEAGVAQVEGVNLVVFDYRSCSVLHGILNEIRPQEIYHLASPSCIRDTLEFESDIFHASVTTTLWLLRWIEDCSPNTRLFFASSSEIFGDPLESPQNERTAFQPQNPYAIAKLAGGQLCEYYRENKDVFASVGILFNHESPLRRLDFVSRRISRGVAEIAAGRRATLSLGNLEALRDWSHAADFARAFRLMMEAGEPGDFVLASGVNRTVRDFCEKAFAVAGLDYRGSVVSDPKAFRSDFRNPRLGDPSKARNVLGWNIQREFSEMVSEMVLHDLEQPRALR